MPRRTIAGDGKKVPLNMRTTAALRRKIEKAAGKSGRSLVQEVEHRVERSFYGDEALQEIDRMRGHILGMLNVLDGKVERYRQELRDDLAVFHARQSAIQGLLDKLVNGEVRHAA
jgi:hypothetical protein